MAAGAEPPEREGMRSVTTTSYEDLYRTDYARMVRVAHMLTGSNETAEDVVQDAFVGLYSRFDSINDPAGYLYRSVVNGCRARQRHKRVVERFRHLMAQTDVGSAELDETWTALKRLPSRRRAVIVLRYYADLPLKDIAEILGCKTGTVKSMLHRALTQLREVIPSERHA